MGNKKSPTKKKPMPKTVTVRDAGGRDLGVYPRERVRKVAPNAWAHNGALIVPDAAAFLSAMNSGKPLKQEVACGSTPKPAPPSKEPKKPKPKPVPPEPVEQKRLLARCSPQARPIVSEALNNVENGWVREAIAGTLNGRTPSGAGKTWSSHDLLCRMVRLLLRRGTLSEQDGRAALENPEGFVAKMLKDPGRTSVIAAAIDGMQSFYGMRGGVKGGPKTQPETPKPKPAPKPKPTSLENRLLNWAAEISESSRPDIGQRLTAQALAAKQAAVFSFNKAARTAGRSWSRAFEGKLPYPVTVVELPNYADIEAVAFATDSAGRIWPVVIGSRGSAPEAVDEAKRLVQFVVDTCTQHVTSGGQHVAISHVVEMRHTRANTVSSIPVTSNPPTKPKGSGKAKPHAAAKKHHVRGHWRLQRVGEGRQQVRRVWVGEHMRGGHAFAHSSSERCPAGFYHVRMA